MLLADIKALRCEAVDAERAKFIVEKVGGNWVSKRGKN